MKASIVVLAYGDAEMTNTCIRAVRDTAPDVELIVIDNGSDGALDHRSFTNQTNVGYATGCNQGALMSHGDIVVFLNNDTEPRQGWLEALLTPFEDPSVGITGATLRYPDGRIQAAGISVDFSRPWGQEAVNADEQPGDVDAVTGACLAIRRDLWAAVGGFDTSFWNGYEDVDLNLRVKTLGRRVVLTEADVMHHESAGGPERWTRVAENIERLRRKWT